MTSDKDKKIEDAATNHVRKMVGLAEMAMVAFKEKYKEPDYTVLCETVYKAGANFGYELAQEELKAKVESLQDNLKFISKSNDRLSKSYNFDQQHISDQAKKITELEQQLEKVNEIILSLTEVMDNECRLDHHGYCQSHFLEKPCTVRSANEYIETHVSEMGVNVKLSEGLDET